VVFYSPSAGPKNDAFLAELAGFLSVTFAATFENCVKEILVSRAGTKHTSFGHFASCQFEKLNSKVSRGDLERYADMYAVGGSTLFKSKLDLVEDQLIKKYGVSAKSSYANILRWRHAYAHSNQKLSTLGEVLSAAKYARFVVFVFERTLP